MARRDARSAKRYAAGACCLAAATIAFAVLVASFVPVSPTASSPDKDDLFVGSYPPLIEPERVEDVQFGSELSCDEVVQGKRFSVSEDELVSLTDDERTARTEAESWEVSYEGLSLSIGSAEVIDGPEFVSDHPGYCESNPSYEYDWEFKAVVVEVFAANRSMEDMAVPSLLLWSKDFRGASDSTGNGLRMDKYALAELVGNGEGGTASLSIPGDWNVVKAGEARSVSMAYIVQSGLFEHPSDYESLAERDLCLSLSGYDPAVVYRLWLG